MTLAADNSASAADTVSETGREKAASGESAENTPGQAAGLAELRDAIDGIDSQLVNLLQERFRITLQIGLFKKEHGLPPADPQREARQLTRLREIAEQSGLNPELIEQLFAAIFAEVKRRHQEI